MKPSVEAGGAAGGAAGAGGGNGAAGGQDGQAKPKDDVVDAEFVDVDPKDRK